MFPPVSLPVIQSSTRAIINTATGQNAPSPSTTRPVVEDYENYENRNNAVRVDGVEQLGKYHMRIALGKYKRPNPRVKSDWTATKFFYLPLPTELRDTSPVSYSNVNLETVGDLFNGARGTGGAAGLRAIGNIGMRGADGLSRLATNAASAVGGVAGSVLGGITNAVTDETMNLISADQISSAIQQSQGIAPNPNPSVLFQGPQLRDFVFSWAFYPRNARESLNVQKMIRELKSASLPTVDVSRDSALLGYPMMCQLNFFPWDTKGNGEWNWSERSIIRLKKCMIQDVFVSYNAFGTPSFFEGTELPTSYQVSIAFKEVEYMLSNDWGGGRESVIENLNSGIGLVGGALAAPLEVVAEGVRLFDQPGGGQ